MLWAANDILLGMVEEAGNTAGKLPTPSWSELDIPIPDEAKQEYVVKELTVFQDKLAELESLQEETAEELAKFQSALLAKAFRGEL
jgi:restriction endonuclease S subunit